MKELKENKNLLILLAVAFIYTLLTLFLIGPMKLKNQELESQKTDILISKEQEKYISSIDKSSNKKEDLVLSIQNNFNEVVDVKYIDKENIVKAEKNIQEIKVNVSSDLQSIDGLKKKISQMDLENKIERIEIAEQNTNLEQKLNYTIVFNVE